MLTNLKKLLKDEEAPTAAEYAVMLGALVVLIIGGVVAFRKQLLGVFERGGGEMDKLAK